MRRLAAAAVVLVAAALAPPGLAGPLTVRATFDDATVEFGAPVSARVTVLFDPAQVRAGSVHVVGDLAPLTTLTAARTMRAHSGSLELVAVDRTAACISDPCVAEKGAAAPALQRVVVTAQSRAGRTLRASAPWPALTVRGRVTAADVARGRPPFLANTSPQPVSYGIAPSTLLWLLIAAAIVLALAGAALAVVEARALAHRRRGAVAIDELERALRLVREAEARPPADRRRALGLLARLLDARDGRLAGAARTLAWSQPEPEPAAVDHLVDDVRHGAGS